MATTQSASRKTTTKKATAKKTTATKKRPSGSASAEQGSTSGTRKAPARKRGDAPRASAAKRMSGSAVAAEAARQLLELTGREAEGVTGLARADDGWKVQVEVVEVRRIPDTTDILAVYEVEVDSEGDLQGYRRLRRYARGVAGEEQ